MVRVLWSCRRSLTKLFILTIYFGTHETHYFPFVLRHLLHQSSQCNKVGREENIRLVLVVQVGLGIDALPLLVIAADNRSVDAVDGTVEISLRAGRQIVEIYSRQRTENTISNQMEIRRQPRHRLQEIHQHRRDERLGGNELLKPRCAVHSKRRALVVRVDRGVLVLCERHHRVVIRQQKIHVLLDKGIGERPAGHTTVATT